MRRQSRRFEINTTYNNKIQVFDRADRPYRCYNAKCLECGNEFIADAKTILDMAERGYCGKCGRRIKTDKCSEDARTFIGAKFGDLEIIDFAGIQMKSGKTKSIVKCRCLKCGSVTEIPLMRLKQGGAKQCKYCSRQNLKKGYELTEMASKEGTNIFSLNRSINKNSTTGINGVSYMPKINKYRAYINFKRKQYHLGTYSTIEEAAEARKKAEEHIYGEFLEWYAENYPEQWEKLQKKEVKKNE